MDRRQISHTLLASLTGAALLNKPAVAQSCSPPCFPQTPEESAAGVVPTNTSYQPGNVKRYGAIGNGSTDDRAAFVAALSCNRLIFVPATTSTYRISSEIVVNRSDITIMGETKYGCRLRLDSAAAPNSAVLRWNVWTQGVHIERVGFALTSTAQAHKALRFAELRSTRVLDCWFEGVGASDDTTAIQLDGTGTFTGDVTIERCYITSHKIGVDIQGVCTTVRVVNCEIYGPSGAAGGRGIKIANTSSGVLISGCSFDQCDRGVYSEGAYVKQIGNYFESPTPQWEWVRGSGNARVWNQSIGDTFLGNGVPIFPKNDWDACFVAAGPGYLTIDNTIANSSRGFSTLQSQWSTPPLTIGSYRLWIDASGRLRIKNGAPTSDTNGTIVGTQV